MKVLLEGIRHDKKVKCDMPVQESFHVNFVDDKKNTTIIGHVPLRMCVLFERFKRWHEHAYPGSFVRPNTENAFAQIQREQYAQSLKSQVDARQQAKPADSSTKPRSRQALQQGQAPQPSNHGP